MLWTDYKAHWGIMVYDSGLDVNKIDLTWMVSSPIQNRTYDKHSLTVKTLGCFDLTWPHLSLWVTYMDSVFFHTPMHKKCHCVPWQHCEYWTTAKDGLLTDLFDVLLPSVNPTKGCYKIIHNLKSQGVQKALQGANTHKIKCRSGPTGATKYHTFKMCLLNVFWKDWCLSLMSGVRILKCCWWHKPDPLSLHPQSVNVTVHTYTSECGCVPPDNAQCVCMCV